MRSSVVFPQPEGPSSVRNSPGRIASETSSTAVNEPNFLVTLRSSTISPSRDPEDDGEHGHQCHAKGGAEGPIARLAELVLDDVAEHQHFPAAHQIGDGEHADGGDE